MSHWLEPRKQTCHVTSGMVASQRHPHPKSQEPELIYINKKEEIKVSYEIALN